MPLQLEHLRCKSLSVVRIMRGKNDDTPGAIPFYKRERTSMRLRVESAKRLV